MYLEALKLITKYNKGIFREGGESNIIHPIRVSCALNGEVLKTLGLLHDIFEDTDAPMEEVIEILDEEYASDMWEALICLTHCADESYVDYIKRVKTNTLATQVKLADICDNLMDKPSKHAISKYVKALNILIN